MFIGKGGKLVYKILIVKWSIFLFVSSGHGLVSTGGLMNWATVEPLAQVGDKAQKCVGSKVWILKRKFLFHVWNCENFRSK